MKIYKKNVLQCRFKQIMLQKLKGLNKTISLEQKLTNDNRFTFPEPTRSLFLFLRI